MPVWLHRKANKNAAKLYKTDGTKFLKNKHRTQYMKQLMKLLKATPENHRKSNYCTCMLCKQMSTQGCSHPHKCLKAATKLVDTLAQKWRNCNTTNHRSTMIIEETLSQDITVDTAREATNLRDLVRIFTKRDDLLEADAQQTLTEDPNRITELVVYMDGSCTNNSSEEARAGSRLWYGTCQEIGLVPLMFFFELLFSYVSLAISFYVSFTD